MILGLFASALAGLAVGLTPYAPPPASQVVVYRDAGLIDGLGGGVKPHMAVIVEGAVIKAVLPDQQLSKADLKGAEVVDLSGRYLLPGLVDSHVHLATSPNRKRAEALMRREVYGGVTAVRDMAGDGRALADLARASRVGEIPGPDIFYAALMAGPGFFADQRTVSATQGATAGAVPWMQAVTSQTDLPLAVALARGTSASGIKTYADISGRLLARITAEAHRQGMRVWSHGILCPATPEEVVAAGVDVISHACQAGFQAAAPPPVSMSPPPVLPYAQLADPDNPRMAALFGEMRRRGQILDATNYVYVVGEQERRAAGKPVSCSADLSARLTAQAHRDGVMISAGTDSFSPPEDPFPALHQEIVFLGEKAGLSPVEAIRSATLTGAMAIGQQAQMGTIEPGKLANMVVLAANPLDDLRQLRSVVLTIKRGVRFARSAYPPLTREELDEEDN